MNKRWLSVLFSVCFSALILAGCATNGDQDPAPPEEEQNDEAPQEEQNGDAPGLDEDDAMNKDAEEDAEKDSEDPIEDPEDMNDQDRQDD
ncbi:hypothetical protein [Bacillus sp. V2I10]|uniref:hypothetical protein n=1 Tax=Bacillus sp. V2I10 TaxID=3042276 RepID=UPI002788F026|nr:hypothetical protein [Bacillus sp. V2I10]MDQ0858997.1 PBP1b-binding outer membrane lipoprotein LpoB [Bacillus sp. V2I10]